MGSFLSTGRESNLSLSPPVQTREELLRKHSHHLSIGPRGISNGRQLWFQAVFNAFCSQTESTKYWSESNLKDFMQSSLPTEITPFLADTIPILHRTLLRMGSFPYQNDPEKLLVFDVLRTACILLNHRPEDLYRNDFLLVLMFQSMASLDPNKAQDQDYGKPRDEDDDYHLEHALWRVRNRYRNPNNPRVMISGPANAPTSHFPSSWSKNFDQPIPTAEFRSFLRLMVFLNFYDSHADASNHLQIEKVTNCLLAAFQPSTAGITWDHFNQAITNHMPNLLRGIYQLWSPFIGIDPPPQCSLVSADEIRAVLQDAFDRSLQQKIPSSANILNPAILSQFYINLTGHILPTNISISWSEKGDQLDLNKLDLNKLDLNKLDLNKLDLNKLDLNKLDLNKLEELDQDQSASILLVSGRNKSQGVIFGLFNPKGCKKKSVKPFMVQLAPLHRVFHPLPETVECSISLDQAGGSPTITGQMFSSEHKNDSVSPDHLESHQCIVRLVVHGNSGHFTLSNDASIDGHFSVDAIELLNSDLASHSSD